MRTSMTTGLTQWSRSSRAGGDQAANNALLTTQRTSIPSWPLLSVELFHVNEDQRRRLLALVDYPQDLNLHGVHVL